MQKRNGGRMQNRLFPFKDKIDAAIELIRQYEPEGGYFLAFSGGKDSIVIYDLAVKAGVKFDAHYNNTQIGPPELRLFIKRNYYNVFPYHYGSHATSRLVR